jgi:hypothetical protein
LPTEECTGNDHGSKVCPRGIDRSGQAGWPCPEDDDIVHIIAPLRKCSTPERI